MSAAKKVVAIVQARMTSSRLPGKVLLPILGQPMLALQLERMRRATLLDDIVIATTTNVTDEPIVAFCQAHCTPCFRGLEDDVLSRYAGAASAFEADVVVRITSDCPLIEPGLIDQAVRIFHDAGGQLDYLSNMLEPTFPFGLAVEVFSRRALQVADEKATQDSEREHVTPFIYRRPDEFRVQGIRASFDLSHHRWTVDTAEDFELVSRIFAALYPRNSQFEMHDVLELLKHNPAWVEINRHIVQKPPAFD
jgi:spore coat polysaccharide biosynthesis protein SpsF